MQVLLTPTGPIPAWASRCGGSVKQPARLQARSAALRRVRARARHALPDREAVVDLERAEPALVADAAVRGRRLAGRPALGQPVPRARQLGDRRPARDRPPRRRRSGSARPRRSATTRPAAAPSARCASRDAARARSSRPRRRRSCAASSASTRSGKRADRHRGPRPALRRLQEAQRHRLRAPPVHARRLAAAALAHQRRRDHDRHRVAAHAAARPGGARQADPAPSCRSTTPSTAGRPTRRT